jgi:hypothetical protein
MIAWSAPWWLLGLAALPMLWWLHRQGSQRLLYVSSALLWRHALKPSPGGASARAQALDPAFWRRALILALLCLALAGPRFAAHAPEVVVWIDDSLSMQSLEPGGTRLALGLAALRAALDERGARVAILRSLSDPAFSRQVQAPFLAASFPAQLPVGAARPPPARLLEGSAEHWLLTDGADAAVAAWSASAPLARVLRIGTATENVAIVRLAARAALEDPQRWAIEIEIANLGLARAERSLALERGEDAPWRTSLSLAPGATVRVQRLIDSAGGTGGPLRARLSPADALAADDSLSLALPRTTFQRVAVDPRCGAALRRAVSAHPALRPVAPGESAELLVDCSDRWREDGAARLLLRTGGGLQPVASAPRWLDATGTRARLPVDARLLRAFTPPLAPTPGDEVLLASADAALVVRRAGRTPLVETNLDLAAPGLTEQSSYALLVAALLDRATGQQLLGIRSVAREPSASRIAALAAAPRAGANSSARAGQRLDATAYLLVLALAALALELAAAAREFARAQRHYRGRVDA